MDTSKMILVHDDGLCSNGKLYTPLVNGYCPECGFSPDMQSVSFIKPEKLEKEDLRLKICLWFEERLEITGSIWQLNKDRFTFQFDYDHAGLTLREIIEIKDKFKTDDIFICADVVRDENSNEILNAFVSIEVINYKIED